MKKILKRNKGFTLVECIVAIAIFALMSALVMQILALSIRQYRSNHNVEKDMDNQIQAIVDANNLLDRETTDIAFKFVSASGATNNFTVNDVVVKQDSSTDVGMDRLELNTFDASISDDPNAADKDKNNGAGMVTADIHTYGTKGITSIYISDQSTPPAEEGSPYNMHFAVKVTDTDSILSKAESNAFKISIPTQARNVVVTVPTTMSYAILGGGSIRFFDKSISSKETSYDGIHITFTLDKEVYDAQYKSFAKYFIAPDNETNLNANTFTDSDTPGIYNTPNAA